jgi:hypothetical protein
VLVHRVDGFGAINIILPSMIQSVSSSRSMFINGLWCPLARVGPVVPRSFHDSNDEMKP